jgi:hypothetical protein
MLDKISKVELEISDTYKKIYSNISPWQRTLVARHPDRPKTKQYIEHLIEDFFPLSGDRAFSDDKAIIGGFGKFRGKSVLVIGHEKGHDTITRTDFPLNFPNQPIIALSSENALSPDKGKKSSIKCSMYCFVFGLSGCLATSVLCHGLIFEYIFL